MRLRAAVYAFNSKGLRGFCAHLSGRIFGDAHYLRPASTIDFKLRKIEATLDVTKFVSFMVPDASENEIKEVVHEAEQFLTNHLSQPNTERSFPKHWDSGLGLQVTMYTITRLIKPMNVLETGTANGASALAICGAMSQNGFGILHSVDIRDSTAELVPEKIRNHLTLVRTNGLPIELESYIKDKNIAGENSIFLHDADHSYLGQISDFEIAESQNFNFLISDDVDTSLAFCDLFGGLGKIYFDAPKMIGAVNFSRRSE